MRPERSSVLEVKREVKKLRFFFSKIHRHLNKKWTWHKITTLTQNLLWKALSIKHAGLLCLCVLKRKLKLFHAKRKPHKNVITKSKFDILFGTHGHICILCSKEERDHPTCYEHTVHKSADMVVQQPPASERPQLKTIISEKATNSALNIHYCITEEKTCWRLFKICCTTLRQVCEILGE